jgi:hypothetical protein
LEVKRADRVAVKLQVKTKLKEEKTAQRRTAAKAKKAKKTAKSARLQPIAVLEATAESGLFSGASQTKLSDSGASETHFLDNSISMRRSS